MKSRKSSGFGAFGILGSLTIGAFLVGTGGCGSKSSGGAAPAASGKGGHARGTAVEFPVEVAPIDMREIGYVITAPGSINAFEQVQVTARVAGAVDKVSFTEGANVTQGQVLATIESDRYQVAVDQAKAALDKSNASEAQAEAQLARRAGANAAHPGLVTGDDIATYQTNVETAKADVSASQQGVKVAQLNLRDSFVRAPISGTIQTRTVDTGQYLQPGAVLATLLQRDPLLLKFQVTEQDAPRLKPGMPVNISMRESANTYQAAINLVAGSADPTSHLVQITALIDDKDHKYWLRPGAFCDVSIPVGGTRPAAVVPEGAIRASENGFIAFVIQGTIAKQRVVTEGMHTPGGLVEITTGLNAGDLLVLVGAEPLSDGSTVKIAEKTTIEQFDAGAAPAPTATTSATAYSRPTQSAGPQPSGAPAGSGAPAPVASVAHVAQVAGSAP
jgi:membrane fusion protein, multidrug efflux system